MEYIVLLNIILNISGIGGDRKFLEMLHEDL